MKLNFFLFLIKLNCLVSFNFNVFKFWNIIEFLFVIIKIVLFFFVFIVFIIEFVILLVKNLVIDDLILFFLS